MSHVPVKTRWRIVEAYRNKEGTYHQLADRFGVGYASVSRILSRFRQTGDVAPKPRGGNNPARISDADLSRLHALVTSNPSLTRAEFADAWYEQTGVSVSPATIGRALKRAGFTRKKS